MGGSWRRSGQVNEVEPWTPTRSSGESSPPMTHGTLAFSLCTDRARQTHCVLLCVCPGLCRSSRRHDCRDRTEHDPIDHVWWRTLIVRTAYALHAIAAIADSIAVRLIRWSCLSDCQDRQSGWRYLQLVHQVSFVGLLHVLQSPSHAMEGRLGVDSSHKAPSIRRRDRNE